MLATLVWGSPHWFYPVAALVVAAIAGLGFAYWSVTTGLLTRWLAPLLKLCARRGGARLTRPVVPWREATAGRQSVVNACG